MPRITFWFDFASTYAYLSAMRIDRLAADAGVEVAWRPFLLGPIFKAQGWSTSPFNLYPAKGRYMIRDITRIATARGLVFHIPEAFPARSLLAARVALALEGQGAGAAFAKAVFEAEFAHGSDISDRGTLRACLDRINAYSDDVFDRAESSETKQLLVARTAEAEAAGIFGSPAFVTSDGELFWGDDRLEQALAWAVKG